MMILASPIILGHMIPVKNERIARFLIGLHLI